MARIQDATSPAPPAALRALAGRYDPEVFDPQRDVRVRLAVRGGAAWDALIEAGRLRLEPSDGVRADATLTADEHTWRQIATNVRGGMAAFHAGRLRVRHDLHLGVGLLAATSGSRDAGRLRFAMVETKRGRLSTLEAGDGDPVIAIHGLGATKASLLPTVAGLADRFRVIAVDLPGFGDSDKPLGAPYDARFFARAVIALLDTLDLERAHLVGNSLGGRVALEVALHAPERVDRLGLLAPSMAWRKERQWAKLLRLVRPELGAIHPAPRPAIEAIVDRVIPGGSDGWAAAGVDEFLRSYTTRRGRAAFYAAARQIYLEEPEGEDGFWPRLRTLERPALFVWGRKDTIVPLAFSRHVSDALPTAEHLELDCGHVPQLERPRETHAALARFFTASPAARRDGARRRVPATP
jgi:pimeloyl-ACP methyl ester carboxylesterase